ncbi:MAG: 23S rRNA (adenine(2503)-C(2))-methyltransferase RlmN [Bacteroidales bacterium]|nr:23S rRNA (adenine(2503)-C(2))-methyltransferase RlmN [Bacteroidales bacterium]
MMNLFGMTLTQVQALCDSEGWPRFTARQICDWLYAKRAATVDAMTNISLARRARLAEVAMVERMEPCNCQVSADGTKKYLFATTAGSSVEAVFIPEADRATLCVSSQAGCKMGCRFCVTGQNGFHGQLTAGEILSQLFTIPEFGQVTNIVYMGMGEPMDNLEAVLASTEVLTAPWGLGWSPKRITVSTVGLLPQMRLFLQRSQCHLAVSLHNPVAAERLSMMPMEKAWPIAATVEALKEYDWSGQRRLSFEYTMFGGLNDDICHADLLARMLRGLECRVNLIRYHASPGTPYRTSSAQAINAFRNRLQANGVNCTLRASRGEDIKAACGLLAGTSKA